MSNSCSQGCWLSRACTEVLGSHQSLMKITPCSWKRFSRLADGFGQAWLVVGLLIGTVGSAHATVGWELGDMVLDYGLSVESGDATVILTQEEVGEPFFAELIWRMNPKHCLLQIQEAGSLNLVKDDGLFGGTPFHAIYHNVEEFLVTALPGQTCEIDPSQDDFLVLARASRSLGKKKPLQQGAAIGAVVTIFRATTFFSPKNVTIHAGQKVVWIYADGAQEPHSVTSGGCRGADCSGGGKEFNSGLTLNKPGHRFEHVFENPGVFPYHCDLHLGSMEGVVTVVEPSSNGN